MSGQIKIIETDSSLDLIKKLDEAKTDGKLRVLILSFSDETRFETSVNADEKMLKTLGQFPLPIILIIKDEAENTLFEIVLAAHICIASDSAKFTISDKKLLKKHIGSKNFSKLNLISDEIDADNALDLGIINAVFEKETLKKEVLNLAEKISELAPLAIQSFIKAVNQGLEISLEDGLELETKLFSQIFATEDMKEGTGAFLEKRKPLFSGKRIIKEKEKLTE